MNGILLADAETQFIPIIEVHRDSTGKIVGGLVVGDILTQNQALILTLHPGELKSNPSVGCGISDMLLDNNPLYWRARIREQLEMDGQQVEHVKVTKSGVTIKATY